MFRRISLHLSSERFNTRASHIQCCPRQPRDSFSLLEPPVKRVRNATSLALEDDSLGCVSVNGHDNFAGWPLRFQTSTLPSYMCVARQANCPISLQCADTCREAPLDAQTPKYEAFTVPILESKSLGPAVGTCLAKMDLSEIRLIPSYPGKKRDQLGSGK